MTDAERFATRYCERLASGVCVRCGGPRDDGRNKCSGCRARYRACPSVAVRADRARNRAQLVCIEGCGTTSVDSPRCEGCRAIYALKEKERYAARKAAGVCTTGCGRKPTRGTLICGTCKRRRALASRD